MWNALTFTDVPKWEPTRKDEKKSKEVEQKSHGQSDFVSIDPDICIKKQGSFYVSIEHNCLWY